ncbi:MAG: hypothetical protein ACE5FM_09395, partial [Methyloligellaceae bacterium]
PKPALPAGIEAPWPLSGLVLPAGNILFLSGEPGQGKTTLLHSFAPNRFDSSEQQVPILVHRFKQLFPDTHTTVHFKSSRKPQAPPVGGGVWAIDSLTNLANGEEWYESTFHDWIKCEEEFAADAGRERWGIATAQATKAGEYRGSSQVPHLADICVHLVHDHDLGLPAAEIWKNRYGATDRRYFELGERLTRPQFTGPFGIAPHAPSFALIPPWSKDPWKPPILDTPLNCIAFASLPDGRRPGWARRAEGNPSPAERFCHLHGVCLLDATGTWQHIPNCLI